VNTGKKRRYTVSDIENGDCRCLEAKDGIVSYTKNMYFNLKLDVRIELFNEIYVIFGSN
jgi:hypothetical protein